MDVSLQEQVSASLGKSTTLVYQREGQSYTVTMVPRLNPPAGQGAVASR
jgi:hypothetical protein